METIIHFYTLVKTQQFNFLLFFFDIITPNGISKEMPIFCFLLKILLDESIAFIHYATNWKKAMFKSFTNIKTAIR